MSAKPLVFLDVDGVLNAVTHKPNRDVWPDYDITDGLAGGGAWSIVYSPSVVRIIADWHASGVADVRWLTTWEDEAVALGEQLGLPMLEVAGRRREVELHDDRPQWWKLTVVQQYNEREPTRPFVWIDDDLLQDYAAREWLDDLATPYLAIAPATSVGINREELIEADLWLDQLHAERTV